MQRIHTSQAGQYKISVKTQTTDLKQALNNVKYACELPFGLDLMAQIFIIFKEELMQDNLSVFFISYLQNVAWRHWMQRR